MKFLATAACSIAFVGSAAGVVAPAAAAPVSYADRAAFDASAPGAQVLETFEGFTTGVKTSPLTLAIGRYEATSPTIVRGVNFCAATTNTCLSDGNIANARTFSQFAAGTSGFGVDLRTTSAVDNLLITVVSGAGTYSYTPTISTTASFFGVSDTSGIQQVSFAVTSGGRAYTLDNVATYATPEPAAWGLMIFGFGAVGGTLRRRRRGLVTV